MCLKLFLLVLPFLVFNLVKCDEEDEFVGRRHFGDIFQDDFEDEIEFYASTPNVTQYPEQWAEQRLDHFNPTNVDTWKQRYFVNLEYFNRSRENSPIFLEIQGEWTAGNTFGGAIVAHAKYYQAAIVKLEHRYYGHSFPTEDASTENLQYLSSEQALQDAATFIELFKQKYNVTDANKWIIFGGSYAGSLSAWFRLKYSHLVVGAIASSAPVEAILDFDGYLEVVDEALGSNCTTVIQSAVDELGALLKSPNCSTIIDKFFGLCEPLDPTNSKDVSNLVSKIVDHFSNIVQYNQNITGYCSRLTTPTNASALEKVATMLPKKKTDKCLDVKYENYVRKLRHVVFNKTDQDNVMRDRLWTYQTCTEFGFFQTTTSTSQPFGKYLPIEFFTDLCVDLFGKKFNPTFSRKAIQITNNYYGGFRINPTNVVFANGLIDPWHRLSILKPINPTTTELIIPETAHCFDMHAERKDDPQSLKDVRQVIRQKIGTFLAD